ncbi:Flagellar basal-body rod protein FlgG [Candidatus Syntrophocurvum alkaliphilum]|uniref:Flagellar basal-body rod protein FlgG n=1 Tax=Candidatus Syntrophocurvum alkaliphilum TaxID=2293317 RepID=A0A6I6DFG6_9FIRM|nr:flagellar basal-body rod protein FlgG [Candidatus Syntrophocurvum alkaliphilum]QGT99702.1 Flagellar basal-body rod protein FlgG [Candidatus Syntrophocurvum alkaliphilum]
MMRALYTASTGMHAQQLNVDTLAHNMSNVNTTAYKKQRVEFQDLLYQTIRRPAAGFDVNEPVGLDVGLGVKPAATHTLFTQGNFQATDNPLDIAINGNAFFQVEVPGYDEPLYTRDGALKIDAEGQLVTSAGHYLLGVDFIEEEAYDITIESDGTVSYMIPDDDQPIEAGQIELAKFINPSGLDKLGENLYQETINSGEAILWDPLDDSTVSLQSGYLEASNVQIVEEMVNMITAQRAYEINSKVIQSSDEMLQTASNLRR